VEWELYLAENLGFHQETENVRRFQGFSWDFTDVGEGY